MLKSHPIALGCIWVVILLALPAPLIALLNVGLAPAATSQLLPIDAGIVAYVWWLAATVLATRPRWLDRLVGLPKMYLVHSLLGVGALALAYLHRHFLMSMGRWIKLTGNIAWYLAVFGIIYAFVFLSGVFVDRFAVVTRAKRWLEHVFNHQVSIWLHRLNLVAILLIWLHVNLIGRIAVHAGFMTLFDLYTVAALGCYCWAKWGAPTGYLQGTVVENRPLSNQTQRIIVEFGNAGTPDVDSKSRETDSGTDRSYPAGSYYFFQFPDISGESHPFSVSSAPNPGGNDALTADSRDTGAPAAEGRQSGHRMTLTVRKLGDYTRKLATLQIGSEVHAEGPFGQFNADIGQCATDGKPVVLIGMGTGVAPLLSLAQEYAGWLPIHVLWTVSAQSEAYFDQEFQALAGSGGIRYNMQIGRLKAAQIPQLFSQDELAKAQFFIVGPAQGVIDVEHMLKRNGVNHGRLVDERLTM